MAGRGSRFAGHNVDRPKPLIEIHGRLMIEWAMASLAGISFSKLVFVALKEHEEHHHVTRLLHSRISSDAHVILLPTVTEGQLCTVLAAKKFLDSNESLLIASSDTLVVSNLSDDITRLGSQSSGIISVADLPGDRWSFARTAGDGSVVEVAEKVRISNHASTGLYYFSNARTFVEMASTMIRNGEKIRGEFYVIPLYQKYIEQGLRVDISRASEVWDMGTPESLREFSAHLESRSLKQKFQSLVV